MCAQRKEQENIRMYSEADEDIKIAAAQRVIELRNEEPPITYKRCTEMIKGELGIEVTRNNIYNIITKYKKKHSSHRVITRKPSTKHIDAKDLSEFPTFNDVDKRIQNSIIKKVIQIRCSRIKIRYRDVVDSVLKNINVRVRRHEINAILKANIVTIRDNLRQIRDKQRTPKITKKKKVYTKPRIQHTINVETRNGIKELKYEICNLVFSGTINSAIVIEDFIESNPDARYNPSKFPGIVIKIAEPMSSILLFKTGRFVAVGLRELKDIEAIKEDLYKRIISSGTNISLNSIHAEVKNIVLTTNLPNHSDKLVDLNMLGLMLTSCMYEPEVFPGLIYKLRENADGSGAQRAVFLIFSSKKVVCVGVRKFDQIQSILTQFIRSIEGLGEEVYIDKFSNKNIPDELRFLDLS